MRLDTVTIVLSGDVPLMAFAKAIARFDALVRGLPDRYLVPERG